MYSSSVITLVLGNNHSSAKTRKAAPRALEKGTIRKKLNILKTSLNPEKRKDALQGLVYYLSKGKDDFVDHNNVKSETIAFFEREIKSHQVGKEKMKGFDLIRSYLKGIAQTKEEAIAFTFILMNSYIKYSNRLDGEENLIHQSLDSIVKTRKADCDDMAIFCSKLLDAFETENKVILMYWDKEVARTGQDADVLITFKLEKGWGNFYFEGSTYSKGQEKPEHTINPFIKNGEAWKARWVNVEKWLTEVKREKPEIEDSSDACFFYIKGEGFKVVSPNCKD